MSKDLLIDIICWLSLSMSVITSIMVMLNTLLVKKIGQSSPGVTERPLVSILVPVRNEAHHLKDLIPALLRTTYQPIELIVLDDGSVDDSAKVVSSLMSNAPYSVRLVHGAPWSETILMSGKAHACAQLAEIAKGEILIFCDADVKPAPMAIEHTVNFMMKRSRREKIIGVSALPAQLCQGGLERLLIPWIMHLPLMMSLPLFCAWRLPFESMQVANGQWLAVFRGDYMLSGGHQTLGNTPLDDVALSRQLHRTTGRGIQPILAVDDISVAMYPNWRATIAGFSKNLVAIGGGKPIGFGCMVLLINFVFLFPIWGYFVRPDLATASFVLIATSRVLTARVFKMPLSDLILHPISLLLLDFAAYKAIKASLSGSYQWKDRVIKWSPV